MYKVKAGSIIQIEVPKARRWYHASGWMPYTTKEDKIYEKEEVWDFIALRAGRNIPEWAVKNIEEFNRIIICRAGKFAMVHPSQIEYLD